MRSSSNDHLDIRWILKRRKHMYNAFLLGFGGPDIPAATTTRVHIRKRPRNILTVADTDLDTHTVMCQACTCEQVTPSLWVSKYQLQRTDSYSSSVIHVKCPKSTEKTTV
jgi:hypothetical protein